MAKFGSDVTSMSAVGSNVGKYISEGVVDRSEGIGIAATTGLLEGGAKLGMEAYKGSRVIALSEQEQKLNEEYMAPRRLATEAASLSRSADTIFENGSIGEYNAVSERLTGALTKYQKAMDQGVMSPEEFTNRSLANLRSAVNKNPGMLAELSNETKRVFELSGMQGIIKDDILIQKNQVEQANEYRKNVQSRAEKQGLDYDFSGDPSVLEERVKKEEKNIFVFDRLKQKRDETVIIDKDEGRKWLEENGRPAIAGGLSSFRESILALGAAAEAGPEQFSKISAQVKVMGESYKSMYRQAIPVNIMSEPGVKDLVADNDKAIDSMQAAFDKYGSGTDWKTAMTNQFEIVKTSQDMGLRQRYDVANIDLVTKILAANPNFYAGNKGPREAMFTIMSDLIGGYANTPAVTAQLPKVVSDVRLSSTLTATAKLGAEMSNDYTGFNKVVDSFNTKAPTITNPTERNIFISNNLEAISKSDLTGANVSTITKVKGMVSSYMEDKSFGVGSMFGLVEKHKMTVDVLPDGRVSFIGPRASDFNNSFGVGINHALGAYAKAHGITTKEAAGKFYPEYFDKYVTAVEDKSK